MSQVVYIKSFNTLILQFLGEMLKIYPNEKDIIIYEAKIRLLSSTNPRMLVQEFMETVGPI